MKHRNQVDMTLEEAMTHYIGESTFNGEKRKKFNNIDAAETYSESLMDLWNTGLGHFYGAYLGDDNKDFWEVSYERV